MTISTAPSDDITVISTSFPPGAHRAQPCDIAPEDQETAAPQRQVMPVNDQVQTPGPSHHQATPTPPSSVASISQPALSCSPAQPSDQTNMPNQTQPSPPTPSQPSQPTVTPTRQSNDGDDPMGGLSAQTGNSFIRICIYSGPKTVLLDVAPAGTGDGPQTMPPHAEDRPMDTQVETVSRSHTEMISIQASSSSTIPTQTQALPSSVQQEQTQVPGQLPQSSQPTASPVQQAGADDMATRNDRTTERGTIITHGCLHASDNAEFRNTVHSK